MHDENTAYWLWLVMVLGVADPKLHELLKYHDSVRELYYQLHDPDCRLLSSVQQQRAARTALSQAQDVMERCEKQGIGIMTWESPIYPAYLRHIYNPPAVLFYKGDPTVPERELLLTVVGTRHPSAYSVKVADALCRDLTKCGLALVSGCAVGLDAAAHRACVAQQRPTVAVLGCGVDYDYPYENRELKARIAENGLLLSEYFPGTQPLPAHFPVRNRILSGIGEGVLVIEAGERSGALITANLACEQGKYVFCVPPADLFDRRYNGVHSFLREGAVPVFSYLDVVAALYQQYPYRLQLFDEEVQTEDSLVFRREPERSAAKQSRPAARQQVRAVPVQEKRRAAPIPEQATPEQRRILELLEKGGQNLNAVCCLLDIGFEEASVLMVEMEMLGWIVNTERDIFALPEGSGSENA